MADGVVALARRRLGIIASGVSADGLVLNSARVYLGTLAAAKVFAGVFTLGFPELQIGSASLGFSGSAEPLVIEAELRVALDGGAAQEWANVDNLVQALRSAWLTAGNYPGGELAAERVDFESYKVDVRGDATIVRVLFLIVNEPRRRREGIHYGIYGRDGSAVAVYSVDRVDLFWGFSGYSCADGCGVDVCVSRA
jgi:hypothetical protein